ncbi:hypothetical protein MesoLjLa_66220 (plasmid) [Mesorhizobium sp. L-2-11]|nr:hypothetical protein MesoLjLa_66220 [Mesorhizobium sp. L-2-11]
MDRKENRSSVDIYAKITDRIVAHLEEGVRPWVKPSSVGNSTGRITRPQASRSPDRDRCA